MTQKNNDLKEDNTDSNVVKLIEPGADSNNNQPSATHHCTKKQEDQGGHISLKHPFFKK